MVISEISKRYASALLSIVKPLNRHQLVLGDLTTIAELIDKNSDIKSFVENPLIPSQEKGKQFRAVLNEKNTSKEVLSLIDLLAQKKRLQYLSEISEALRRQIDLGDGVTRGVVQSARPLTDEMKKSLESKIKSIINKKIVLTYQTEPALIGGLVAQVGGWKFDDSIDTHLKNMKEELNRRVN